MSTENPWKILDTKLIYRNPWMTVREHQVVRPDGSPGIYGVVDAKVATGVVAVTPDEQIYLVGQYRFPIERYSWEIIEGGAEPGEDPLVAIRRELREEAGLEAREWAQLGGECHLSNCFSSERALLYCARGLTEVPAAPDATEILTVRKLPFRDALKMVETGEISDAMTIMALLRLAAFPSPWG